MAALQRLIALAQRHGAELRMRGLAIGFDLGDEAAVQRVERKCRRKGLLLAAEGSTLLLLPALNVPLEVVDDALDRLAASL